MQTLFILGPSGVGKSPLEELLRPEVQRLNPYRLRPSGPRDAADCYYTHADLEKQLRASFGCLGELPIEISENVEWYTKAGVLLFKVRGERQILFLSALEGLRVKGEIYAPVLVKLLAVPTLRKIFGELRIILLNPAAQSVCQLPKNRVLRNLKKITAQNLRRRGDSTDAVNRRIASIDEEFPAWRELVSKWNAVEYCQWSFPEYRYKTEDRPALLRGAKDTLLKKCPELNDFFV